MKKLIVILLLMSLALSVSAESKAEKAMADLERAKAELRVAQAQVDLAIINLGQARGENAYKAAQADLLKAQKTETEAQITVEKAEVILGDVVCDTITQQEKREGQLSPYGFGSLIFGSIGLMTCLAATPYAICYPGSFQVGNIEVPYWAADAGLALVSLAALNYAWNESHPCNGGCLIRIFGFNAF